ncbi:unnamed protein product [Dovyalis caffra]|uniref:Uncharacterized protein n=1 Tax=Dovyalis caffra TaxID=77055 RepID=A0AAV1RLT9_9ROSI|nr:unnamed protein product [Dovyalis caffra]
MDAKKLRRNICNVVICNGNRSGNDSNSWDTLESRLYNCFFGDADRIADSYLRYGRYSQYESYEDNDNTVAYYRGAMIGQSWDGSHNSYLEDDEAIARELHQSYNSHLADDAAIARELQEMEDSLGSMSLYDGPFGSITDSEWDSNRGRTSAQAGREVGVDLDNMSYEETSRFEESLGRVSKGLSQEAISRLPKHKYSPSSTRGKSGGDTEIAVSAKWRWLYGSSFWLLIW